MPSRASRSQVAIRCRRCSRWAPSCLPRGWAASYRAAVHSEPQDLERTALADAFKRHWRSLTRGSTTCRSGSGGHHWEAVGTTVRGGSERRRPASGTPGRPDSRRRCCRRSSRPFGRRRRSVTRPDWNSSWRRSDGGGTVVAVSIPGTPSARGAVRRRRRGGIGDFEGPEERRRVATLLGRLHAASGSVPCRPSRPGGLRASGKRAARGCIRPARTPWDQGRSPSPPDGCFGRTRPESGIACAPTTAGRSRA